MKILLLALLLWWTLPHADALVVSGEGRSFEEAKHNAFRTAIEYTVGAIVAAEQEVENNRIRMNEILTYSSGYISSYKILNQSISDGRVSMTIDIEVSETRLKDFLLSKPNKIYEFESQRHQAQVDSYFYEREQGDRLLLSLLRHYPKKAFELKQGAYRFKTDSDRGVILEVPYELRWNYDFLTALNNTLAGMEDGSKTWFSRSHGKVSIMAKNPDDLILGATNNYYFNDLSAIDLLREKMKNDNEPRISISISSYDNTKNINMCIFPKYTTGRHRSFYRLGSINEVTIFGNEMESGVVRVELGRYRNVDVGHIKYISISVVSKKDCRTNRTR